MIKPLRVALFTDSFTEANGVATVSQKLTEFARRRDLPFLCVYGGDQTRSYEDGLTRGLVLRRGLAAFRADHDLYCDPLLSRHRDHVLRVLSAFSADLVHITGPGDIGIMGLWVAHILRIPLVASWHTNLHEYMGRRLEKTLAGAPRPVRMATARQAQAWSLDALMWFYRMPRFVLAPNQQMASLLRERTGRPAFRMGHGVDLETYAPHPRPRTREPFRIGYVGRLTPEKNVRSLVELERRLLAAGAPEFRFLLVGEGSERTWLKEHLRSADLPGTLRGQALADAFLSMDAFVFPSRTDTYGLVVLEAMASGVPAVVNSVVSSALSLKNGHGGLVSDDPAEPLLHLMQDSAFRAEQGALARQFACARGWQPVFDELYATYAEGLAIRDLRRAPGDQERKLPWNRWSPGEWSPEMPTPGGAASTD